MNDDTNLIDISMLQQLQDQFCCADHLYLMCVDKNKGVVTKPFGTEEQVGFLRTQVDKHAYMELVDQMQHDRMETVVERETAHRILLHQQPGCNPDTGGRIFGEELIGGCTGVCEDGQKTE